MKRLIIGILVALMLALAPATGVMAATTADQTVTFTFAYIAIADNVTSYDFGVVAASSTTETPAGYVGIDNTSSVQTDQTISVTGATWTGGAAFAHSESATPGADTVGLKANRSGDVIVKNASPNNIYENCPATTDYTYKLILLAPTTGSDGVQKTNTVRVSAAAG